MGGQLHRYVTNVLDPGMLSLAAVAAVVELYGRRWDIELAGKLVKRDLGRHLLGSARWELVQTELVQTPVWAVLLIAQIALGLRRQVAQAAGVDEDDVDVSLHLLLRDLPDLPELVRSGVMGDDVGGWLARHGRRLGSLRPSSRLVRVLPVLTEWEPPPPGLPTERPARSAGRRCGPNGTNTRPTPVLTRN